MRVLLLGELSGLHQELRPGLERAGLSVTSAHSRMAYPGYPSDVGFFRPPAGRENRWTTLRDIASQVIHAPELTGFDVVQVMTPKFFNWKINGPLLRYLKRNNGSLVAVNTACTSDYHRRVSELRYSPCAECKAHDLKSQQCIYDRADERSAEYVTWDLADAIVSTHFEYDWSLRDTHLTPKLHTIPLPIDTLKHRSSPMPPIERVRIWYGETRYGFKGGRFIAEALERVKANFAGQVEVVQTPRLAFDEYLRFLDTVHIVVDQTSSYGPGMNALYALARGRVVLTGAENENNIFATGESASPVVNAEPDAQRMYDLLASLILQRSRLSEMGESSREYVERVHGADVIGRRYRSLYRASRKQALAPTS